MFEDLPLESYSARELAHFELLWAFGRSLHVRGIESGAFAALDADVETTTTWAVLHGFVQLALSGRLPLPMEDPPGRLLPMRDALIESRLRGLVAQAGT